MQLVRLARTLVCNIDTRTPVGWLQEEAILSEEPGARGLLRQRLPHPVASSASERETERETERESTFGERGMGSNCSSIAGTAVLGVQSAGATSSQNTGRPNGRRNAVRRIPEANLRRFSGVLFLLGTAGSSTPVCAICYQSFVARRCVYDCVESAS